MTLETLLSLLWLLARADRDYLPTSVVRLLRAECLRARRLGLDLEISVRYKQPSSFPRAEQAML